MDAEDLGLTRINAVQKDSVIRAVFKTVDKRDIEQAAKNAKIAVDDMFNKTEKTLFREYRSISQSASTLSWSRLSNIDKYAKELSYPAFISISATQHLRQSGLTDEQAMIGLPQMSVAQSALKETCPLNQIVDCIPGKYRTYSGHCNNVNKPLWGAIYEPMQRLQNPEYSDGVSVPRSGSKGNQLPSARIVSKSLFSESRPDHAVCSLVIATWAQFIYEDVAQVGSNHLFVEQESLPIPCCKTTHPECFNIGTDSNDELFKNRGLCMSYTRSIVAPRENCSLGIREQGNLVTSFLDGSQIYGNDKQQAVNLRSFQNG